MKLEQVLYQSKLSQETKIVSRPYTIIDLRSLGALVLYSSSPSDYHLLGGPAGFKIFGPGVDAPLTRLDFKPHEHEDKHLQHGESEDFDRTGNEAANIFAEIYRLGTHIKFPWEK